MALHFNAKDLMGERFVHLEVVRLADQAERKPGSGLTWICRCDCGTEIAVRGNRLITVAGVSRTLAEWSRLSGIPHDTIAGRLKRGWTQEDAMRVAVGKKR